MLHDVDDHWIEIIWFDATLAKDSFDGALHGGLDVAAMIGGLIDFQVAFD